MRLEVLCTGDELLTGVTVDTNSPWFMERALRLGLRVVRTTVIGDDRAALAEGLREIAARADAVLVSGGLGPTSDDLTVDAAADAAGVALQGHEETLERLEARFARRGLQFTENNARQARVPEGAEVVANAVGSAPMFVLRIGRCLALFVPGVPREYKHLVEHEVLPRLSAMRAQDPNAQALSFRLLRTVGLPESHLDMRIEPVRARHPDVEFGFRTQLPENHLKLLAKGATQADADRVLVAAEADAMAAVGEHVYGRDEDSLAGVVVRALAARGLTVSVAESCTGGMVASMLTQVPGASAVFPGGLVPYAEGMKEAWLGVPRALLAEKGVVSAEVAQTLAEAVRQEARTDWGVGITGYAGPTGGDAKEPVGAVYISVAGADGTKTDRHVFGADRERNRQFASWSALDALRRRVLATGEGSR